LMLLDLGMARLVLLLPLVGVALGETYDVAVIPPPIGFTSVQMSGINNSGQVAGFGVVGNTVLAFVGSPEGSAPIPLPAGYYTARGLGLNSSGQVAGWAGNPSFVTRAFIGTPSGVDLIPLPEGWTNANAYGVNDSGVAVGSGGLGVGDVGGSLFRVFIGSAAVPLPLEWTTGFMPESVGYAINNEGQIVGYVTSGTNTSMYIGTAAGVNLIHAPRGWNFVSVGGLNDSGEVAVLGANSAMVASGASAVNYQGFVYTASGTLPIPIPKGATAVGFHWFNSLNNSRTVVGWSGAGAWIWSSSHGTVLLNALVPSVWNVTDVFGISDNGLILAQASFNGGVSQFVELSPARPHPPRR
jgi:hypothetical protein